MRRGTKNLSGGGEAAAVGSKGLSLFTSFPRLYPSSLPSLNTNVSKHGLHRIAVMLNTLGKEEAVHCLRVRVSGVKTEGCSV